MYFTSTSTQLVPQQNERTVLCDGATSEPFSIHSVELSRLRSFTAQSNMFHRRHLPPQQIWWGTLCLVQAKSKDTAVNGHSQRPVFAVASSPTTKEGFKQLMDCCSRACRDFDLTIWSQKTTVMGIWPHINEFIIKTLTYYLMNLRLSTNSSSQSFLIVSGERAHLAILDKLLTFTTLIKRVWSSYTFTQHTKVQKCRARVVSTPACRT